MRNKLPLITFLLLFCLSFNSKASHLAGGEVSYESVGNNRYVVTIKIFKDCASATTVSTAQATLNVTSTCGFNGTFTLPFLDSNEVSQLCPSQLSQSACRNGNLPGMQEYIYRDTVTLSPNCNYYTLSWTDFARNNANANLVNPGGANIYVDALLYSGIASDNSSPTFTAQPIPYFCAGTQATLGLGVVELDGDSLVFSLAQPLDNATLPVAYAGGNSVASPFPNTGGITINSQTGQLTFTPSTQGIYTIVILCKEYDRATGQLIGYVKRDIEIVVRACSNQAPDPSGGVISGLTGQGVQTGNYTIELCEGNSIAFNSIFADPNGVDILTVFSPNLLQGMTLTSSPDTGTVTAAIAWTAPPGSAGSFTSFTLVVKDNACPIFGQQFYTYYINVIPATNLGPDKVICSAPSLQNNSQLLTPIGGSVFQWYTFVNPGDSIALTTASATFIPDGNNFDSVTVIPNVDTYYVVVSNLSSSCRNRDTIFVTLAPDFTLHATPPVSSPANICLFGTTGLLVTTNPVDNYTFLWTPSANLNVNNFTNPVFTGNQPGTFDVIVTITNSLGCVKRDTARVIVSSNVQPVITALANPLSLCPGDSTQLGIQFGNGVPAICGPAAVNCTAEVPLTLGAGANTTGPTPFSGLYEDGRYQMIIRASELTALGYVGGKISSLTLNVTNKLSQDPYANFTIKMGCTSLNAIPTISFITPFNFIGGLTQVYTNPSYTSVIGTNLFNFNSDYEWDGTSNLLIEFCFDNGTFVWSQNDNVSSTNVGFNAVANILQDGVSGCTIVSTTTPASNLRPNVVLGTCGSQPDPNSYNVSWTPNSNLSNDSIINPYATIYVPITYQVIVTDIVGGCSDTSTVFVDTTLSVPHINPVITYCLNSPADTLTATPPAGLWSGAGITNTVTGIFNPSIAGPGSHWVYYTKTGNCGGVDSALIMVRDLPHILPIGPLCNNDNSAYLLQINDTLFNGGVFSSLDFPGALVNDTTFVAFGLPGGDYTVLYTLSQCVTDTAVQSIEVHVASFGTLTATAASSVVCIGDSTQLGVLFNNFSGSCAAASTNCTNETPYTIGTGNVTGNTPTPFGGFYEDGKFQMLISAAELSTAGFVNGKISSLTLNVTNKSSTVPYENFTIKLGCTSLTQFPNGIGFGTPYTFTTGLTQVYTNASYSTVLGNNIFNFSSDYIWDGSSNLLIEFCFNNNVWTNDDQVAKSNTSFNSSAYFQQDGVVGCNMVNTTTAAVAIRPNVILGTCSSTPPLTNYSFTWSPSTTISDTSIINPFAFPSVTTTYTVTVRDTAFGCFGTASIVIDTTTMPPSIIQHSDFCFSGSSDTLFANIAGGVWSGLGITDPVLGIFDPSVAGVGGHWVYYTKTGNCGGMDSSLIYVNSGAIITQLPSYCSNDATAHQLSLTTAIAGGTYTSSPSPAAITTSGTNYFFTANGLPAGNYLITYTNNTLSCPTDTMTIVVQTYSNPNITTVNTSYCSTDAVNHFIGATTFGGNWFAVPATAGFNAAALSFNASTAGPGVYTIYHQFTGACGGLDSVIFTVVSPQAVAIQTPPTTFCQSTAPLTLAATPAGGTWTGGTGIVSNSSFNPALASTGANVLTYTFGPAGCTSSATVTMTVNPTPSAPFVSQSTIVCFGSTSGNLVATGASGATFNWYQTSALTNPVSNSNIYNPNITAPDSFYVTQTIGGCSSAASSINVSFYPNPVAAFSATPTTGDRPLTVAFFNGSTGNSLTYLWNFGDTASSIEMDPAYIYESLGDYNVLLTVTSINGCTDTASIKIVVTDIFEIVVPNVFTPNNDGSNDFFYFKSSTDVGNLNCMIFDRWGKKVYEMTSANDKWSGEGHPAGVYFYTITATSKAGHPAKTKDAKGNPIQLDGPKAYSGFVQLIREK